MSTDKFFCVSKNEKYNDIQNDGKDVLRVNIIRKEHQNCAIFKKNVSAIDEELVRTTLYTPSRRISQDVSKETGGVRSNYITTESHLETFLIYLKDIEVKLNDAEILSAINEKPDDIILAGELNATPYAQMLTKWMSPVDFPALSETKTFASCIYQMKKILRAQLECAQEAAEKYGINYFTFADVITPKSAEEFEKYYYKYYRVAGKEYAGLNMLVKIDRSLQQYNNVLDKKHIKGVILVH